jgi:hypothetical protein
MLFFTRKMVWYLAIKVVTCFADTQDMPTQPERVERGKAGAKQDVPSVPACRRRNFNRRMF